MSTGAKIRVGDVIKADNTRILVVLLFVDRYLERNEGSGWNECRGFLIRSDTVLLVPPPVVRLVLLRAVLSLLATVAGLRGRDLAARKSQSGKPETNNTHTPLFRLFLDRTLHRNWKSAKTDRQKLFLLRRHAEFFVEVPVDLLVRLGAVIHLKTMGALQRGGIGIARIATVSRGLCGRGGRWGVG